jgi:hypothetical protein
VSEALEKVTPQKVSAVLRKAGFQKSESHASAVKGWRNRTIGYRVRKQYGDEDVRIEWEHGFFRLPDHLRPGFIARLEEMKRPLEGVGIVVELNDVFVPHLVCKGIKK